MQGLLVLQPNIVKLDRVAGRSPSSVGDIAARFSTMILEGLLGRR
jgi:hypothetical protein